MIVSSVCVRVFFVGKIFASIVKQFDCSTFCQYFTFTPHQAANAEKFEQI